MTRETKVEKFIGEFNRGLMLALQSHPQDYALPPDHTPVDRNNFAHRCTNNMRTALLRGSYNHDGRAMAYACRQLGIKHTRTGIEAFLES